MTPSVRVLGAPELSESGTANPFLSRLGKGASHLTVLP